MSKVYSYKALVDDSWPALFLRSTFVCLCSPVLCTWSINYLSLELNRINGWRIEFLVWLSKISTFVEINIQAFKRGICCDRDDMLNRFDTTGSLQCSKNHGFKPWVKPRERSRESEGVRERSRHITQSSRNALRDDSRFSVKM